MMEHIKCLLLYVFLSVSVGSFIYCASSSNRSSFGSSKSCKSILNKASKKATKKLTKLNKKQEKQLTLEQKPELLWQEIITSLGYEPLIKSGSAFFFADFLKGDRLGTQHFDYTLRGYHQRGHYDAKSRWITYGKNELKQLGEALIRRYKIHLMPKGDFPCFVIDLARLIKKNKTLKEHIHSFKVLLDPNESKQYNPALSKIIIYVNGKNAAQAVLNELYVHLKNLSGEGKPRYSAKVTDLIWATQGDGDHKPLYKKYFVKHFVYFKPDFTGVSIDHCLYHPGTNKPLKGRE